MSSLSDITTVILAGGMGTRIREELPGIPKALAEISGKPFITILLDRLKRFNIRRIIICTGHLGHMIQDVLGDTYGPLRLIYSHESSPLGTAGALGNARHLLPSEPVLVINGDSYCHTDLEIFYAWFQEKNAFAAILLTHVTDTGRYGRVEIDSFGHITSFNEKTSDNGPGMINAGIYLIDTGLVKTIPGDTAWSLEKDVFPALAGNRLTGFQTHDPFLDIGTRETYQNAPDFFARLDGIT